MTEPVDRSMSDTERTEHKTCDTCGSGIQIYTLSEASPQDDFLKVEEWGGSGAGPLTNLWFCGWGCASEYGEGGGGAPTPSTTDTDRRARQ